MTKQTCGDSATHAVVPEAEPPQARLESVWAQTSRGLLGRLSMRLAETLLVAMLSSALMPAASAAGQAAPTVAGSSGLVAAANATPLPLLIVDAGATDPAALYGALSGVVAADARAPNRFTWDVGRGEVADAVGEGVATVLGGDLEAQLARVQGVIDKWTVLRALERLGDHLGLDTRVEPDTRVHHDGERLTVVVRGYRRPYFTLLNLASDGTVNFIYPMDQGSLHDSLTVPPGGEYRLPLQVTAPFGADHFIAIASATALTELHQALKAIDGQMEAASILELFDRTLAGQDYQLGVQAVFSAR